MSQIDKIQVGHEVYDVGQSSNAIFIGTSNDTSSPSAWTEVQVLTSGETNGSIFTKISKMFANIRWLYNQLGTTDYSAVGSTVSSALSNLQTGKAAASHSHTVADLPISTEIINSSTSIPVSSVLYNVDIAKENKGKCTIGSTEYTVAVSSTDAGTTGYITFVIEG